MDFVTREALRAVSYDRRDCHGEDGTLRAGSYLEVRLFADIKNNAVVLSGQERRNLGNESSSPEGLISISTSFVAIIVCTRELVNTTERASPYGSTWLHGKRKGSSLQSYKSK